MHYAVFADLNIHFGSDLNTSPIYNVYIIKGEAYIEATEPRLHSNSKDGRMADFVNAALIIFNETVQFCS